MTETKLLTMEGLEAELFPIVERAIKTVGIEAFKRTSLFGSNEARVERPELALAA